MHDCGVRDPKNDAGGVSAVHAGGDQICAGRFDRHINFHPPIEVFGERLQIHVPLRRLLDEVLLLVLLNEAIAEIVDIDRLPVELSRMSGDRRLDIVEQLFDIDLLGIKRHLLAVAEQQGCRGIGA